MIHKIRQEIEQIWEIERRKQYAFDFKNDLHTFVIQTKKSLFKVVDTTLRTIENNIYHHFVLHVGRCFDCRFRVFSVCVFALSLVFLLLLPSHCPMLLLRVLCFFVL